MIRTGTDYYTIWVIPIENLTEGRFAGVLKSLSNLPETYFPEYEPENPDAFLTSTLRLPTMYIQGIMMDFSAQKQPGLWGSGSAPAHLGFLIAHHGRYTPFLNDNAREDAFLDAICRISEGMGAVFATHTNDSAPPIESFKEFYRWCSFCVVLSDPLVESIGRERLKRMGRILEWNGGIGLIYRNYDEIRAALEEAWKGVPLLQGELIKESRFDRKGLRRIAEFPPYDWLTQYNPSYWGQEEQAFFLCYIPIEAFDLETCTSFVKAMDDATSRFVPTDGVLVDDGLIQKKAWYLHRGDPIRWCFHISSFTNWKFRKGTYVDVQFLHPIWGRLPFHERMDREGMRIVLFKAFFEDDSLRRDVLMTSIEAFASQFNAVYGFGDCKLKQYGEEYTVWYEVWFDRPWMESPEAWLWPINLFRIGETIAPESPLIKELLEAGGGRWSIKKLMPSSLLLIHEDLDSYAKVLMDEPVKQFLARMPPIWGNLLDSSNRQECQ